jgi:hypothetical protein
MAKNNNKNLKNKAFLGLIASFFVLTLLFVLPIISAIPTILELNQNGTQTSSFTYQVKYNFSSNNDLAHFSFIPNMTYVFGKRGETTNISYAFLNNLVLFYNFDNRSYFLENDTFVTDMSGRLNLNGTNFAGTKNLSWTNGSDCISEGCFKFTGNRSYFNISTVVTQVSVNNSFSVAFWFKLNETKYQSTLFATAIGLADRFVIGMGVEPATDLRAALYNGSDFIGAKSGDISTGKWYFLVYTYDNATKIGNLSLNLQDQTFASTPITYGNRATRIGAAVSDNPLNYTRGVIDEFMIFNKALNYTEIKTLQNLTLSRYDYQNYTFKFNQTIYTNALTTSNPSETYVHRLCMLNFTGTESCSSLYQVTRIIPYKILYTNFTLNYGTINDNFYGVNNPGKHFLKNGEMVDTNNDGILDTLSNISWNRQALLDSKIKVLRFDMNLENLYQTTTDINGVNFVGDLSNVSEMISWLSNNSIKPLLIVDYMPNWLADNSSGTCKDLSFCPASNYSKFSNIVLDYLNRVTNNGAIDVDVEIWNEPYRDYFMYYMGYDNMTKALNYTRLYDWVYTAIKATYPQFDVGAPAGYRAAPNLMKTFLTNESGKFDFISIHPYIAGYALAPYHDNQFNWYETNNVLSDIQGVYANCTAYGVTCNKVYATEYNSDSVSLKNNSVNYPFWKVDESFLYTSLLKNYPANASLVFFSWSERYNYFNNPLAPTYYPEYPQMWSMVSEPQLNNYLYPPYNVTRDFATYCPIGSKVIKTDDTGEDLLYSVVCESKDKRNLTTILINADSKIINVTLNYTSSVNNSGINNLVNKITGVGYSNPASIILQSYDVLYLTQDYNYSLNSVNYNTSAQEGSVEGFYSNITIAYGQTLNYARLYYNGTPYTISFNPSISNYNLARNITIPKVSSPLNVSLKWEYIINGLSFNTTNFNQTIIKAGNISINNICPSGYYPSLNFSFVVESNLTIPVNASASYNVVYGISSTYQNLSTINGNISNIANFYLCINNSQSEFYVSYGEIQYTLDGFAPRRFYIFPNTRITNTTTNNYLYLLDSSSATDVQFTAETTTLVPYNNGYIGLMRWYPNLNSYNVVEIGKTDDKGQTVLKLKLTDVDYRVAVYDSTGSLVKLFNPFRMVCSTTPCTYTLFIDLSDLDFTTYMNIESNLSYNSITKVFTYIYNDPSQDTTLMNMTVYQDTGIASTPICSSSSTSFTGILSCDVSSYTGNLRAVVYRSASPAALMAKLEVTIKTMFSDVEGGKTMGLIFTIALALIMGFIGIFNPLVAIIGVIIALIPMVMFGVINKIVLLGVIVLGGIVIHFIRRIS